MTAAMRLSFRIVAGRIRDTALGRVFLFGPGGIIPIDRFENFVYERKPDPGEFERMNTEVELLEAPHHEQRVLDENCQRLFDQGAKNLVAGRNQEALANLREAHALTPDHAQLRSLLGVAIARVDRNFEESRSLCESAAKQEFFNPDLYLNLSHVYLEFGRRSEALRYLRRGQMIDPGHALIRREIGALGKRRLPIVRFLPRKHPVNRALGSARNLVMGGLRNLSHERFARGDQY